MHTAVGTLLMTELKRSETQENLEARLERLRLESEPSGNRKKNKGAWGKNGVGFGMRIGGEVVAALVVGVGIGLFIDSSFNTKPWFMVTFFVIGAIAGFFNVYRVVKKQGSAIGYQPLQKGKNENIDKLNNKE